MREMKDSGIAWIGAIPQDWGIVKFKYLHRGLNTGEAIDKEYWETDDAPTIFYTAGLTPIKTSYSSFPIWKETGENDLLLARNGTPYVYLPVSNAYYTDHIIRAAMSGRINRKFVYYCLQQSIASVTVDSVSIPTWSATLWNNQILPCPSTSEQERITTFLDAECAEIDAVLEKTRASIEEYKKLKQAVITQAVTKGIFDKQIYPHNVKLKYLLYIASGDAIRNEELSEVGKYPAYGGGESLGFASTYNTLENSLIIGRVGARCGCVTYIDSKAWATDNALIVRPICNPRYMYYVLINSQLNNLNTSNAQPLITATKVRNVVVPYFLEDIYQKKIVEFLDGKCAGIDVLITKKQQYLTEIENYKKSLIYEYVTGKKEVV